MFEEGLLNSITVSNPPAAKEGYHLVPRLNGTNIMWVFEKDENDGAAHAGTYLDPIPYVEGMSIEEALWYTDGDNIWEALKNGTPVNFSDREYFDII